MPSPAPLGILCLSGLVLAVLDPASVWSQTVPASPPAPATPAAGKLFWRNGQSLAGRPTGADADSLRWASPYFAEPADLALAELRSLTLPGAPEAPTDSFSFVMRDGSRVFGEFLGLDETHFQIRSRRHGDLKLSRGQVASVNRIRGGGVLWSGPFGTLGWTYQKSNSSPPPEGRRWFNDDGGALATVALRQRISLPWTFASPVEVSFRIRSSGRPEFELQLLTPGLTEVLTTWDDELVLRRGNQFLPLATLADTDRTLALRLFWDPRTGRGAVTTPEGKVLGSWEVVPEGSEPPPIGTAGPHRFPPHRPKGQESTPTPLPPDGITWTNRGRDLFLEALAIRSWNGELPTERPGAADPAHTSIETGGDLFAAGPTLRLEGDSLVAAAAAGTGERRIPLADLISLRLPLPAPAEPNPPAPEAVAPSPPRVRVQFADGTTLGGESLEMTGTGLSIRTAFCPEPVTAPVAGLQEIRWNHPPGGNTPLDGFDRVSIGNSLVLHGHWVPAPGARLHWRPVGASAPVPLATGGVSVEITRATPPGRNWPRSPSLLFLKDGQIAPAELTGIDQDGKRITVRSDLIGVREFPGDAIDAVQFPGRELNPDFFADPGWHPVRGGTKAGTIVVAEGGKSVTLDAGQSFGHPSILAGEEIQFELMASGYGTARLRMFADGTDREGPSTRLLIAHYGSEVYAGIEDAEGNFESYKQFPAEQNQPVRIRLSWNSRQLQVFVNGSRGTPIDLDPKKAPRPGRGLIFEPGNLWGNGERTITLSDFKLRLSPGYTWLPPVPTRIREQALYLPRFRKADPPAHLLVAHTGDLLRGTIESATATRIAFRAGMESLTIPAERAAAAVWLTPPAAEAAPDSAPAGSGGTGKTAAPALPDAFGLPPRPTHWFVLRSGARLGLTVESFGPDAVTGTSEKLGRCRLPADHVHLIRTSEPPRAETGATLANWTLVPAPEPAPEGAASGASSALVGKQAPKLSLNLLGGGSFDLAKESGHVVILDFWATWCGPCVRALPEMIAAFAPLDPARVKFIAVNQAESPEVIGAFLKPRGWSGLTVALDHDQSAGRAYGVEGIPHTVIIGPDGKVAHVTTGFRPGAAAEAATLVQSLLEGAARP